MHPDPVHHQISRVNECGAEEEPDSGGYEGKLSVFPVRARLLRHLDAGSEERPVGGGQHHPGCESEASVEEDALRNEIIQILSCAITLSSLPAVP